MTTPTLLQAAQKLIACIGLDRIEVGDWPDDSMGAYLDLKRAIAQEQTEQMPERCCFTCAHSYVAPPKQPCKSCIRGQWTNWEPKP